MMTLDPRLHALRDGVEMLDGAARQVASPIANVHRAPLADAMQLTQALMGERVTVFETRDGWAWVKLARDGYVGFIEVRYLTEALTDATHRVCVPQTYFYAGPSIKTQPVVTLTMNALVTIESMDEKFAKLADGRFIFARHLKPVAEVEPDFVEVAQRFLHVPYLWGGKSALGLDCSGLCQLALEAAGVPSPRDSDMQEAVVGERLMLNDLDGLRRGDLVFWDGHVGIMADDENLLHANGHFMQVTMEPLRGAVERIARAYGAVTGVRRL
jgi:cell wall-associated NlpC family hydrolase